MFGVFGRAARGSLAAQPGTEPVLPALKGEVLTTGQPGKTLGMSFTIFTKNLEGLDTLLLEQGRKGNGGRGGEG